MKLMAAHAPLIVQPSTRPLYLQYCWYLQSFDFGQSSPQCHQHLCECHWPKWGDSPRSPVFSWNTRTKTRQKTKHWSERDLLVCVGLLCKSTVRWVRIHPDCPLCLYLGGLLGGKTGRGGRGGLSGRPASFSPSVGGSALKAKPPEVLLPVEVFLRCVRSDRLEEQECSVL